MDNNNEHQVAILNDLLKINLDRIEGYRRAINDSVDFPHLITLFRDMQIQSEGNIRELRNRINQIGGIVNDHTTLPGKIYHAWMEVRSAFSKTEKTVLELCEFGEDAALKAYKMGLSGDGELDQITRTIFLQQQGELKKSHDQIKSLRDAENNRKQNV